MPGPGFSDPRQFNHILVRSYSGSFGRLFIVVIEGTLNNIEKGICTLKGVWGFLEFNLKQL